MFEELYTLSDLIRNMREERALVNRNINENAYITMYTIFQLSLKTFKQVEGDLDAYLKDADNFKSVVMIHM